MPRARRGARSTAPARRCWWRCPSKGQPDLADDAKLREFTCDPQFAKVLVTDGKTAVGQAIVKALAEAGAD